MGMAGYTKLFNSILASTVWRENPTTKVVWITLLAMAGKDGIAEGSVPGLADFARVSLAETEQALKVLSAPDPYSRSQDHQGRRIEAVDGGWLLLNHAKYRAKMNADERREINRLRQARYRAETKASRSMSRADATNNASRYIAEAEAEAEAEEKNKSAEASSTPAFLTYPVVGLNGTPWQLSEAQVAEWATLFPGLDVRMECRKAKAWVDANPGRRKTFGGMKRFLAGWLTRAVDNGGGRVAAVPRRPDVGHIQHDWDCPHEKHCGSPRQCKLLVDLEAAKRTGAA